MDFITYIIVTWNNENEIEECLGSVKQFSPCGAKIIIVDNNSIDGTTELIKTKFPEILLIENKENLGFAAANNLALQYVSTSFICYLNPDVILTEDVVTSSVELLRQNREIGLVACKLMNKDGSVQASCFEYANSENLFNEIMHVGAFFSQEICKEKYVNYYRPKESFFPPWVIGAEIVARTEDIRAIEGFSTEYFMYTEDMDLCKKIETILNKKIFFDNDHSLIHLGGASEAQNVSYNKQKKLFENDIYFVNKFYGEREAKRTISAMRCAYQIRYILLSCLYFKADRKKQIEKTKQAIEVLKEIGVKACGLE